MPELEDIEIPTMTKMAGFRFMVLNALGPKDGPKCLHAIAKAVGGKAVGIRKDMSKASFEAFHVEEYALADHMAAVICTFSEPLSRAIGTVFGTDTLPIPKSLAQSIDLTEPTEEWEKIREDAVHFTDDKKLNSLFNDRLDEKINKSISKGTVKEKAEKQKANRLYVKGIINALCTDDIPTEKRLFIMDQFVQYAIVKLAADSLSDDIIGGKVTAAAMQALNATLKSQETILKSIQESTAKKDVEPGKTGFAGLVEDVKAGDGTGLSSSREKLQENALKGVRGGNA